MKSKLQNTFCEYFVQYGVSLTPYSWQTAVFCQNWDCSPLIGPAVLLCASRHITWSRSLVYYPDWR